MGRAAQDLLRGTVDVLILQAVSDEARHGFGIAHWIAERTDSELQVEDAALYQALHRLEAKGWLASRWGTSENKRRAKFYRLTAEGRKQLGVEVTAFRQFANAVFKVLEPT